MLPLPLPLQIPHCLSSSSCFLCVLPTNAKSIPRSLSLSTDTDTDTGTWTHNTGHNYAARNRKQDEVGTFPNSVAFRIMEEDLGVPPQEVFDFVYPDPIASASIGQVC